MFVRIRSSQEEGSTRRLQFEQYARFEREVAAIIRRAAFSLTSSPSASGDFVAERMGRRVLVEVKPWPRHVPARVLTELFTRLQKEAADLNADQAVVVTRRPIVDLETLPAPPPNIRVVSIAELGPYLEHLTATPQK